MTLYLSILSIYPLRAVLATPYATCEGRMTEPDQLADQLAATRIDSPAQPPSLEALDEDLLQLVCQQRQALYFNGTLPCEELTLVDKLHLRTASKCMCSAMMAAI